MILVLAAIVYFDPKINLVPWPFNVIVFMIICGIVVYLYGFSQSFREESREFFEIKKRW
jgi:high-affinity Fe2+/Pb2+ permease